MLEVTPVSSYARLESGSECQDDAVDRLLRKVAPGRLKHCLQFRFVFWFRLVGLLLIQKRSKLIEDFDNLKTVTSSSSRTASRCPTPAHTSRLAQDWIEQHSPDFIMKDEWPPNSPDLNPLECHVWGAMLEKYQAC